MRLRNAALFVLLISNSLTGQEEPLPVVTPRSTATPEIMLVALATEPIREFRAPTLAEAARNNDYVTFDALYREARARGENVAQFAALHELWTYNMTSPIGAFFDAAMYERLARAYPGFAEYIDEYAIVDSNGRTFYPTAETREFVLSRAIEGRTAARTLIAGDGLQPPLPQREAKATTTHRTATTTTTAPKRATKPAAIVAEKPAPTVVAETTHTPTVEIKDPIATPVQQPQPAPVAVAEAQPVQQQPAVQQPATIPATTTEQQPLVDASATSRGILLIVIGLIGVGLLAVMFRTPKENIPPSAATVDAKAVTPQPDTNDAKPAAPVEPIRARREKNRASGSRG